MKHIRKEEKKLTGYPSIDKPWLKCFQDGTDERANNIPPMIEAAAKR